MSAFYSICENLSTYNGITFYDHISAKTEPWGEYLQKGRCFFLINSCNPLSIKVWWKSVGKRKIDRFSYLNLCGSQQEPKELIETGIFNSNDGKIDLKKDFALLDAIAKRKPHLLNLPNFCSNENLLIAFTQKEVEEFEAQLLLFDLTPFTEEKEQKEEKISYRKINKISFLGVECDHFKKCLEDTEISFCDCIHPDSDILVYSSDVRHKRGNYEPFVRDENLLIPENSLIFHDKTFDDILNKHGFNKDKHQIKKIKSNNTLTFIDFETANSNRDSICAVGISVQENGKEIDYFYSLVRPEPFNIERLCKEVHGLDYCDLKDAPTFDAILPKINEFLDGIVVAHNADFDMDCLSTYLYRHNLDFPDFKYLCTKELSEFISEKTSLDAMSEHYNLLPFKHHNALADARACGALYWKLREDLGAKFCEAYLKSFKKRLDIEKEQDLHYKPTSEVLQTIKELPFEIPEKIDFKDRHFIVTGNFVIHSRKEVEYLIKAKGGKLQSTANKESDYIIIGELASDGWAHGNYGRKIETALTFPQITFVKESDFVKFTTEAEWIEQIKQTEHLSRKPASSREENQSLPLYGKTFVITGCLASMDRSEAKKLIESLGGKIASAVTSQTSFLVYGDDIAGSKMKKALDFGTPILSEDDFLEMIKQRRSL